MADDATVEVPPADGDEAKTDDGPGDLNSMSDAELQAMQAVVTHFLPEGVTYADALSHVGQFGFGDNAEYRFVPPADWGQAEVESKPDDDSTQTVDPTAVEVPEAQTAAPAPATSKAQLTPKTVSAVPSAPKGPVRKTWNEMSDDEVDRTFDKIISKDSAQSVLP